jgi:hypothetical protein
MKRQESKEDRAFNKYLVDIYSEWASMRPVSGFVSEIESRIIKNKSAS